MPGAGKGRGSFVRWLEEQVPSKTAPSGIGRENYTWWLRNVHLVPMSWEETRGGAAENQQPGGAR